MNFGLWNSDKMSWLNPPSNKNDVILQIAVIYKKVEKILVDKISERWKKRIILNILIKIWEIKLIILWSVSSLYFDKKYFK